MAESKKENVKVDEKVAAQSKYTGKIIPLMEAVTPYELKIDSDEEPEPDPEPLETPWTFWMDW